MCTSRTPFLLGDHDRLRLANLRKRPVEAKGSSQPTRCLIQNGREATCGGAKRRSTAVVAEGGNTDGVTRGKISGEGVGGEATKGRDLVDMRVIPKTCETVVDIHTGEPDTISSGAAVPRGAHNTRDERPRDGLQYRRSPAGRLGPTGQWPTGHAETLPCPRS